MIKKCVATILLLLLAGCTSISLDRDDIINVTQEVNDFSETEVSHSSTAEVTNSILSTQLTQDSLEFPNTQIPEGSILSFVSGDDFSIFFINELAEKTQILENNNRRIVDTLWSPDGQKMLIKFLCDKEYDLFIVSTDEIENQYVGHFDAKLGYISWSPDNKQLAIDINEDDVREIYILEISSGKMIPISTKAGVYEYYPAWSPDGKYLSYYSCIKSDCSLIVMDTKSGVKKVLLNVPKGILHYNLWSPNSKWIAYIGTDDHLAPWYLRIIDSEGKNKLEIDNIFEDDPVGMGVAWSPDSNRLAYVKAISEINIYDLNSNTISKLPLGINIRPLSTPVWSPDGNPIAFCGEGDIYLFDLFINALNRITDSGDYYLPQWRPQ